jgi:hypothetical protein
MPSNTYGRQVVEALVNKSGGAVAAGDVVIIDTTNDGAFTTTTTARSEVTIGVVQEAIASNATGRVLLSGFAALVNVPASVTRGHYVETHTVAKQATGNSSRRSGSFGQFRTGGTTPTAVLWGNADQTPPGAAAIARTTLGTTATGASFQTARGTFLKKITVGTDGFLASIVAYVKGDGTNYSGLSAGVLSDSAGVPVNVLATSGAPINAPPSVPNANLLMNTTARWVTVSIGLWVPAADYWIAVQLAAAANSRLLLAFTASTGSDKYQNSNNLSDVSMVATSGSTTDDNSIYANMLR